MAQALSNMTSGFIDLATYDELEKYMYGGPNATAYFVRETRKATWFTNVPVVLSRSSGQADFGQTWSVGISRAGDYLLQTWLRVQVPALTVTSNTAGAASWSFVPNFMHNLVSECNITFNDLVAARFGSAHLDFWTAFTVPASKQNGYNNMIGNIPNLGRRALNANSVASWLNLPLPFFYSRDSGVALPTAALPYNDMRITFTFRTAAQLVMIWNGAGNPVAQGTLTFTPANPTLGGNVQVWANYAIVSNEERKRMACAPRDILIEQVQSSNTNVFQQANAAIQQYDLRFSHAVKVLFFGVEFPEVSAGQGRWSNYSDQGLIVGAAVGALPVVRNGAVDPIANTSLVYENTQRLAVMGSDYFSLVNPYYAAPVIPAQVGYHSYSYSLDFINLDPLGSTNYGKLTNVSIQCQPPAGLATPANSSGVGNNSNLVVTAVNNNIIRIAGGALGFPVL